MSAAIAPCTRPYGQSKLADSLFALDLHRRLTATGSPVLVTAAHPGYAITNLQTSGPGNGLSAFRILGALLKPILSQNAAFGALPTLYAAVSPDANPAATTAPTGSSSLKGYPTAVQIPPHAQNTADAERLWQVAEQLTGVAFRI